MTTRRALLGSMPAAFLAAPSTLAGTLAEARTSESIPQVERLMARWLAGELGDENDARRLAAHLAEAGLRWDYPKFPVIEADTVVAYSFGYRSATGRVSGETGLSETEELPEPGPINAMLADAVQAIRAIRPVRVYAQWEIADVLATNHGMKDVMPIRPVTGADGTKTYLSTDGVAAAVVAQAGTAEALGRVAVVGHRDHVKRCILVSRRHGMTAAAAREVPLPVHYDPHSAQPWTRRRDVYLLSDVLAQLTMMRARLLSELAT